jgi:uncharacterized membrane protein YoaK (UPF0700 family)
VTAALPTRVGARPQRAAARPTGTTVLLLALSFIAGMVDVTSFVLLHGLFAAHITGNLVVLAADVATHRAVEVASVVAVLVFVAVTVALTAVVDTSSREPYRWARAFLVLQFGLLAAVAVAAAVLSAGDHRGPSARLLVAVLAVGAMAVQNALLHLTFKSAPSTAVMTGNTVTSAAALVGLVLNWRRRRLAGGAAPDADSSDRVAWQHSWPTLAGFLVGCLLGAAASEAMHWWAWVVPAAVGGVLALAVSDTGLPTAVRRD